MSGPARKRCAIYTRKSSEEGLDQEFNSLDAQREACEAYITSQGGNGWSLVATHYNDGGFSGGTMARPALQRLIGDVRSGRVDVVVVYKIDRLTRALADFAKMVETFEAVGASFVSVTQQFNTTTSMGRLTLNVLLSFAQFEREVTAERIRDKISASKAKGIWMGGLSPLGYEARDRQLVVNEAEAEIVQLLFRSYLEFGSIRTLKEQADRIGLCTKRRLLTDGREQGGKPFSRGHLSALLTNPIYRGKIRHRGQLHNGRHPSIIDAETWDAVQARLKLQAPARQASTNHGGMHLLTGLLFDETGDRLSPSHASKRGRRYRYYISHRLMQARHSKGDGWRLPAGEVERLVMDWVGQILGREAQLLDLTLLRQASAHTLERAIERARLASERFGTGPAAAVRETLLAMLHRIVMHAGGMRIEIDPARLTAWLLDEPLPNQVSASASEMRSIEVPIRLRRRGVEARLVITNGAATGRVDQNLLVLIARAHAYLERLTANSCTSIEAVAHLERTCASEVSRILPLAFLAPDIIRAVITGTQPVELTAERLKRIGPLPHHWMGQRQLLGFAPAA